MSNDHISVYTGVRVEVIVLTPRLT